MTVVAALVGLAVVCLGLVLGCIVVFLNLVADAEGDDE